MIRDPSDGNDTKVLLKVLGSRKPVGMNSLLESDITEVNHRQLLRITKLRILFSCC